MLTLIEGGVMDRPGRAGHRKRLSKRTVLILALALVWGVAGKPSIRKGDDSQAFDPNTVAQASLPCLLWQNFLAIRYIV
jgi:hypothetical protein